jgi:LysM repeat protein
MTSPNQKCQRFIAPILPSKFIKKSTRAPAVRLLAIRTEGKNRVQSPNNHLPGSLQARTGQNRKNMSDKDSAQNVIEAYRRRQQAARRTPLIIGLAALFVIAGVVLLVLWLTAGEGPALSFLASKTPTSTATDLPTSTPTDTLVPTGTSTELPTPTWTATATQSGPFIYQVEEGDNLWSIAQKFQVDLLVLITVNNLDPNAPTIRVGDKLIIPGPDTALPTATALPTNLRKGTEINYQVQLGDSLLSIAIQFNSTVEAIKEENELENENEIFVGQVITVPVNLVTPVPSATATLTLASDATTGTPTP